MLLKLQIQVIKKYIDDKRLLSTKINIMQPVRFLIEFLKLNGMIMAGTNIISGAVISGIQLVRGKL